MGMSTFLRRAAVVGFALILVWGRGTADAESFVVDSVASFQAALTTAQGNGQSDVITVLPDTYSVTATLTYVSAQPYSLTITGSGAASTTLHGGSAVQVLRLQATNAGASLVIEDLTISHGRSVNDNGGGLSAETGAGSVTVDGCEITDSEVTGDLTVGGGAALVSATGDVTVVASAFRRNSSAANVGGLFAATGSGVITVTGCTFEDNSVDNSGSSTYFGDGGGAMLYTDAGGRVTVEGCTFTANTAAGGDNPDGGGLMTYQLGAGVASTVTSSAFVDNQAGLGAGGFTQRINDAGTITCTGNTVDGNTTLVGDGGGGFLYLNSGTLTVRGNTFVANQAAWDGGGLWISHTSGTDTLVDNHFVGNGAANNGGGLTLATDTAVSALEGNLFHANTAAAVGAGLSYATTTGSLDLRAATFHANIAGGEGGAMYIYVDDDAGTLDFGDLILWSNSPDQVGFSSNTGLDTLTVRYSDVQGGTGEPWFATGCIDDDPLFVDAATGDLRLSWANFPVYDGTRSPCIDAGDPGSPLDPDGTTADMGALPFDQGGGIFADGFESGDTSAWDLAVP